MSARERPIRRAATMTFRVNSWLVADAVAPAGPRSADVAKTGKRAGRVILALGSALLVLTISLVLRAVNISG